MDNIRNSEQNKQQNNRTLRDNFKNIQKFAKDSGYGSPDNGCGKREPDQERRNRELRDNFKDIEKFMNDKNYE